VLPLLSDFLERDGLVWTERDATFAAEAVVHVAADDGDFFALNFFQLENSGRAGLDAVAVAFTLCDVNLYKVHGLLLENLLDA
jgi:hypothetical protein